MITVVKKVHFFGCFILLLSCLFLQSCAKYEAKPFNRPLGISLKKDNISVSAHQLSGSECKYYFSKDLTDTSGYQVIHLTVKNHSSDPYVLDAHWIDLHLASLKTINQKLSFNTPMYMLPWVAAALVFWPFLIGAGAAAYDCTNANREINNDLDSRGFSNNSIEVIRPQKQINKFLFVARENWRHSFKLILINKRTNERSLFDVEL